MKQKTNKVITKEQVKKIARLANLILDDKHIDHFTKDLSNVLAIIDEVRQVDATNIVPTSQVTGLSNVFREDVIDLEKGLSQKEAISNAPDTYQGFIKVKAIF